MEAAASTGRCAEAEAAIQKVSGSSCVQAGVGPNTGLNTHGEKLKIRLYSWKGKGDTKIKLEKLISQRDTGKTWGRAHNTEVRCKYREGIERSGQEEEMKRKEEEPQRKHKEEMEVMKRRTEREKEGTEQERKQIENTKKSKKTLKRT